MLRRPLALPGISSAARVIGNYGRLSYIYHAERTNFPFIGQISASGHV